MVFSFNLLMILDHYLIIFEIRDVRAGNSKVYEDETGNAGKEGTRIVTESNGK